MITVYDISDTFVDKLAVSPSSPLCSTDDTVTPPFFYFSSSLLRAVKQAVLTYHRIRKVFRNVSKRCIFTNQAIFVFFWLPDKSSSYSMFISSYGKYLTVYVLCYIHQLAYARCGFFEIFH